MSAISKCFFYTCFHTHAIVQFSISHSEGNFFLERKCQSLPRRSNWGTSVNKDFSGFRWYQTGSVKYSNDWPEKAEDRSLSTGLVRQL